MLLFLPLNHRRMFLFAVAALFFSLTSARIALSQEFSEESGNSPESLPALRWFPSAHLPPVSDPYIFCWYFGNPPEFPGAVSNAQGAAPDKSNLVAQKGLLPFRWVWGPQAPNLKSVQEFVDYHLGIARMKPLAIMVDEWQSPKEGVGEGHSLHPDDPYGIAGSIQGILEAEKINPSLYTTIAWRGEPSIRPLTEAGLPDLLMIESYSHLEKKYDVSWNIDLEGVKKRIDLARQLGIIDRTVPWLGQIIMPEEFHEEHGVLTAEEVERQVAELRRYAPEMPGVFFYSNRNAELAKACDNIARKYFVEPAPEIHLASPVFEQIVSEAEFMLRAEARPKKNRTMREYRWFIDNRLVAITEKPEYKWNTARICPGRHIITVHAIDSGWNRAAAQVPVVKQMP